MITILPYNPTWRGEFVHIGVPIRQALGELALRIDHIGSTAVPGLAAKDVIDVQITVRSLDPAVEVALRRAGYARLAHITQDHTPPGGVTESAEWAKWIFKPPETVRAANVHVRVEGRANQRYPLLFRDYLRAHPATAGAYAQVKQGLVAHRFDTSEAYYAVKDPVCDIIMGGAEAWAAAVGWSVGDSDC